MPHIIAQYSNNFNTEVQFATLLLQVNKALVAAHPTVFPVPEAIKARAVPCNDFAIGIDDDAQNNVGFIHISLALMPCDEETRTALSTTIVQTAKTYLDANLKNQDKNIQLTVEVNFIHKPAFQKVVFAPSKM